jgi:hypothetical protein
MRAGIDLWKHGTRRAAVIAAIALGFAGTVASITGALLWGSILASVLLGRDAMREAERWTGLDVAAAVVEIRHDPRGASESTIPPTRPLGSLGAETERWAILFCDEGSEPCLQAAATLAECAARAGNVEAIAVAAEPSTTLLSERLRDAQISLRVGTLRAVAPLDAVAAFPTLVVVDRAGRIEKALVGAHPAADIDALLGGAAGIPQAPSEPGARRR